MKNHIKVVIVVVKMKKVKKMIKLLILETQLIISKMEGRVLVVLVDSRIMKVRK
jgi:hypothetical protein